MKKNRAPGKLLLPILLCFFCLFTANLRGQEPDVVRITTNLVQVDLVVTKDGKQITNLKPEDF